MKPRAALILFLPALALCECPADSDLPVVHPQYEDEFTCAILYQGPTAEEEDNDAYLACNTCEDDNLGVAVLESGYEYSASSGYFVPIGSLLMMPGCTFMGFHDYTYGDSDGQYKTKTTHDYRVNDYLDLNQMTCNEMEYGYASLKCDCTQEFIQCVPMDEYVPIMVCDNTVANTTMDCIYQVTIGTQYTAEVQESFSVSFEVTSEIHAGLMDIFSTDLGSSVETGYDWSTATEVTFQKTRTFRVQTSVPPGQTVAIEQTVGYCAENESYASYFRTVDASNKEVTGHYQFIDNQLVPTSDVKNGGRDDDEAEQRKKKGERHHRNGPLKTKLVNM